MTPYARSYVVQYKGVCSSHSLFFWFIKSIADGIGFLTGCCEELILIDNLVGDEPSIASTVLRLRLSSLSSRIAVYKSSGVRKKLSWLMYIDHSNSSLAGHFNFLNAINQSAERGTTCSRVLLFFLGSNSIALNVYKEFSKMNQTKKNKPSSWR
jgi:hypothetical protein